MLKDKEYILCAAIWFDDKIDHNEICLEGKTGFVICGRRHHNCFNTAYILSNKNTDYLKFEKEQGFITNTNRFVSRIEAAKIAFEAEQIPSPTSHPAGLFSEDLY